MIMQYLRLNYGIHLEKGTIVDLFWNSKGGLCFCCWPESTCSLFMFSSLGSTRKSCDFWDLSLQPILWKKETRNLNFFLALITTNFEEKVVKNFWEHWNYRTGPSQILKCTTQVSNYAFFVQKFSFGCHGHIVSMVTFHRFNYIRKKEYVYTSP